MPETLPEIIGDLAALIGLSRPAGQCFAAIWRAAQPPCADDLVASLSLSRSNVSTALKELRSWSLITARRGAGERRDSFTAPSDPRHVLRLILNARRQMVLVPIRERLAQIDTQGMDDRAAALRDLVAAVDQWIGGLANLGSSALDRAIGEEPQGGKIRKKKKKKG